VSRSALAGGDVGEGAQVGRGAVLAAAVLTGTPADTRNDYLAPFPKVLKSGGTFAG
jgi:hypothetical protein